MKNQNCSIICIFTIILIIISAAALSGCTKKQMQEQQEIPEESSSPDNSASNNAVDDNQEVVIPEAEDALPSENQSSDDNAAPDASETGNTDTNDDSDANDGSGTDCESKVIEQCTGLNSLKCTGEAILNTNTKTISFSVKNSMDERIQLARFSEYEEENPWQCMTSAKIENVKVIIDNEEFSEFATMPVIDKDSSFSIRFTYSGLDNDYVDQLFGLSYSFVDIEGSSTDKFRITASE